MRRSGAALLGSATLVIVASLAAGQGEEKLSEVVSTKVEQRKAEIQAEVAASPGHAWAGEYFRGDGLGFNYYMAIAPQAGFAFTWHGCLGLYDQNLGSVHEEDGVLYLEPAYPVEPSDSKSPRGLLPVAWGQRHYLIPRGRLVDFANSVSNGEEPRSSEFGLFFLRLGDWKIEVQGPPALPSSIRGYLLEQPIKASIARAEPLTRAHKESPSDPFTVSMVTINAGATEGVLVGMEFHVVKPRKIYGSGKVVSTRDHEADVELSYFAEDGGPRLGWSLSTRLKK